MDETLSRFQKQTPIAFARTLDLIRSTAQGNALMGMFSSNWEFIVAEKDEGKNTSFQNVPVSYKNTEQNKTCSCATVRTCTMPAQLFDNTDGTVYYTFEGFVFGCYLLETVLLSSLSCFYSLECINDFRQPLFELVEGEGNHAPILLVHMDSSSTRFSINDTIETMAYEMFIESWTNSVSYERFFNSCAPSYCTYKYYYRFDELELLTTFLSVFSGLSLGLRFVVPHLIKIIKKIRNRSRIAPLE